MKDQLQLINELCESRMFRSKADLNKYSKRQKQDLYYAVLLSTIALALDTKTMSWARQYASAAAAFNNFDFFRISANDLYVLTYLAQNELRGFDKRDKMKILRLYKGLGRANVDRSFLQQTLLRLERSLFITDTRLRNARRAIINWGQSTPVVRKQTVTQLHRFIHVRAKLAEVLPYLKVLLKGKPGRFGKGSALKDIAAAAAGGLAGLAIGMKADPNRQWRLFNSEENDAPPLNEDRPTQLFQIVQDMKEHPEVEKIVGVKYLPDGISAFVRTTDGNAYEMQIRPAKYAKGHHKIRGIREGWEWIIPEDVVDFAAAKKEKDDKEFWDKAYALHPEWKENDEYEAWFDTLSDEEQDAELAKQAAIYDEQDKQVKAYLEQFRPIIDKIVEFMDSTGEELIGDLRTLTKQRKRGKQHVDPKLVAKLQSVLDNELLMKRINVMDEYSAPIKQAVDHDENMPIQMVSPGQYIGDDGYTVEYFWDLPNEIKKNMAYLRKSR